MKYGLVSVNRPLQVTVSDHRSRVSSRTVAISWHRTRTPILCPLTHAKSGRFTGTCTEPSAPLAVRASLDPNDHRAVAHAPPAASAAVNDARAPHAAHRAQALRISHQSPCSRGSEFMMNTKSFFTLAAFRWTPRWCSPEPRCQVRPPAAQDAGAEVRRLALKATALHSHAG